MPSIARSAKNADNVPIIVTLPIDVSQTIARGDLLEVNATSRRLQAASVNSTTIVGIAEQAITTGASNLPTDNIPVVLVRHEVIKIAVDQTGAKKTFVQADFYTTAYNLKDKKSIDPNNTTTGMCFVQAFDSINLTADVIISASNQVNVG
jgi:hypothetical protein